MAPMSLQTRDSTEAKRLYAIADAALKRFSDAHRNGPISLSQRQIIAPSGLVHKELTTLRQDEPGPASIWTHGLSLHQQARAAGKLEQRVGGTVNEVREKTFRPHELKAILRAALKAESHPVDLSISNAEWWCPWLNAYSGARIAELCNLRGDDLWEDGVMIMHLRKTKGGVPRKVPLHAHLIEQGFMDFVRFRASDAKVGTGFA